MMARFTLTKHWVPLRVDPYSDITAVHMLGHLDKFKGAEIIRSRDPAKLEPCDVIVDVQGKYDGIKYFDHHQREFNDTFGSAYHTRLSSAGLVYKHFGRDVLQAIIGGNATPKDLDDLYERIYQNFVEAVDANDNGISAYPSDIKPKFEDNLSLFSMVSNLNPWWNRDSSAEEQNANFKKASLLIGTYFDESVRYAAFAMLPARNKVIDAMNSSKNHDSSGRILVLYEFVPWKTHLLDLEKERDIAGSYIYVLYPDTSGKWRVQGVPQDPSSFDTRRPLPSSWRGLRDAELSKVTGIDGCIFVHAAGFTGGCSSFESTLEMAKKALDLK